MENQNNKFLKLTQYFIVALFLFVSCNTKTPPEPETNFCESIHRNNNISLSKEIETELTKQARYLDKLIDELAKGRKMEKILRKG